MAEGGLLAYLTQGVTNVGEAAAASAETTAAVAESTVFAATGLQTLGVGAICYGGDCLGEFLGEKAAWLVGTDEKVGGAVGELLGDAAAGAAVGTWIFPGIGTGVGAAMGITGFAIGKAEHGVVNAEGWVEKMFHRYIW